MQKPLSNAAGSDNRKDLFGAIECAPGVIQHGWDDKSAINENYKLTIDAANKAIPLIEYLSSRLNLEAANSFSGWAYKAICPFHKHGHERTASFFINPEQNRFYCQACGASGGVVDFIARKYKRATLLVAEHILSCVKGNFSIDIAAEEKKAKDRKKFQNNMMKLSDLYRNFIKSHIDDDAAVAYINKCFSGFDAVIEANQSGVEKTMEEILKKFENYLAKYSEKL